MAFPYPATSPLLRSSAALRHWGSPLYQSTLRRGAFTLIEMLVVVVIIALLAALVFPMVGNSIRSARQMASLNNMRQWATAFANAVAENNGEMPSDGTPSYKVTDELAWYNRMPPAINVTPLKKLGADLPKFTQKSIWVNPGAPKELVPATGMFFCYGFNDFLSNKTEPNMKVTRVVYPAKTVLMAEKAPDVASVVGPETAQGYFGTKDPLDPEAICNFLFVDGHVDGIRRKVYSDAGNAKAPQEDDLRKLSFSWLPYEAAEK